MLAAERNNTAVMLLMLPCTLPTQRPLALSMPAGSMGEKLENAKYLVLGALVHRGPDLTSPGIPDNMLTATRSAVHQSHLMLVHADFGCLAT